MRPVLFFLFVPSVLFGCDTGGYGCPDVQKPAVSVSVFDSQSGDPVTGALKGVATDGAYRDSLLQSNGQLKGAYGRTGTYAVLVQHPDYNTWIRKGVTVSSGRCGVETQSLEADLQKNKDGT